MSWWRWRGGQEKQQKDPPSPHDDEKQQEAPAGAAGCQAGDEREAGARESERAGAELDGVVELPTSDTLDLHSFRPRDVAQVTRAFLDAAVEEGLDELRLIHGRGTGTQRRIVRGVLAADPRVESYADAAGNWGATVVRLHRERPRDG